MHDLNGIEVIVELVTGSIARFGPFTTVTAAYTFGQRPNPPYQWYATTTWCAISRRGGLAADITQILGEHLSAATFCRQVVYSVARR